MEAFQKEIMLEPSKSRLPGLIPSSEFGFYRYDIVQSQWVLFEMVNSWEEVFSQGYYGINDGSHLYRKYSLNPNKSLSYEQGKATVVNSNADFKNYEMIYFSYGLNGADGVNGNWNKCPCDIDIYKIAENDEHIDLKNLSMNYKFPLLINSDGNRSILRYRNMMQIYYFLNDFYKKMKFYKLCKRTENFVWIEIDNVNFFDINIKGFYSELPLPDINEFAINTIIGVNDEYETYSNYFIFDIDENNKIAFTDRLDISFFNFVKKSFGQLEIPDEINGNMVPEFLFFSEINEWYTWLNKNKDTTDCCIKKKYDEMGGDLMLNYLKDKIDYVTKTIEYFEKLIIIPYISISFSLKNTIDDMGEFSLYSKEWVAGKKYYVGDVVVYVSEDDINGSSYVLESGDNYELIKMTSTFYDSIKNDDTYENNGIEQTDVYIIYEYDENSEFIISDNKNFIDTNHGNKKVLYKKDGDIYLPLAYYCGYYDELNKQTYFDTGIVKNGNFEIYADDNNNFTHWKCNVEKSFLQNLNVDGYNKNWDISNYRVFANVESKLFSLRKFKKSYDDYGNELPGIIEYGIKYNSYTNQYEKYVKDHLGLIFEKNQVFNLVEINDDINNKTFYYGDIIKDIEYGEVNENGEIEYYDEKKQDSRYIKFTYYIGSSLYKANNSWEVNDSTGVKYVETYSIEIDNELNNIEIDGKNYEILYFDKIDFDSKYITIYDQSLDFAPKKAILSDIEYTSDELFINNEINDSYNIINSKLFKEEFKLGITFPLKSEVNVYVDRGINAAFEKHLILGEINTYQDMENYRNNYFNLS